MSLNLIDPVHSILGKVEELTGKKIEYVEKKDLPVLATIQAAKKNMPAHRLLYNKDHNELINYLIANECGHILRIYSVSEEKRKFPVANQRTLIRFMKEMEPEIQRLTSILGFEKIKQLIIVWYDGIAFQLTKMPTDIMIEKWMYSYYPELRPIQLEAIAEQREKAILSMSDSIRKVTPAKIYDTSHYMNYTFFKILGDHFHINYVEPYNYTRYFRRGEELAAITERNLIDDHEGDIMMIDKWAEYLGLTSSYEWTNYEDIRDDYLH